MLWLILSGIVAYLLYKYAYKPTQYWKERNVSYIKPPWPIIGNTGFDSFLRRKSLCDQVIDNYNKFPNERYVKTAHKSSCRIWRSVIICVVSGYTLTIIRLYCITSNQSSSIGITGTVRRHTGNQVKKFGFKITKVQNYNNNNNVVMSFERQEKITFKVNIKYMYKYIS